MNTLIEAIRNHKAILFVGAGVSATLGLPPWGQLITRLAQELGYEPELFEGHGDQYSLAEFYALEKRGLGALRSWMDRTWHAPHIDIKASRVHQLIVALKCPIIYTTNYDRWLELAHEARNVACTIIARVTDLIDASADKVQIIKFHGDFQDDESLVLTESSYFERMTFDSPLDVRLRSDLLGRHVLFVGYSLTDINIRLLLYRLSKMWKQSKYEAAQPQSYLFMTRPNAVQERVVRERGVIPIVGRKDDHTQALDEFLTELVRQAHGKTI